MKVETIALGIQIDNRLYKVLADHDSETDFIQKALVHNNVTSKSTVIVDLKTGTLLTCKVLPDVKHMSTSNPFFHSFINLSATTLDDFLTKESGILS